MAPADGGYRRLDRDAARTYREAVEHASGAGEHGFAVAALFAHADRLATVEGELAMFGLSDEQLATAHRLFPPELRLSRR